MSSPTRLRAVILEDRESDVERLLHELVQSGYDPECEQVRTEDEFRAGLESSPDAILANDGHRPLDATRALAILQELNLDIPLLIISGESDDDRAAAAVRAGASDFVTKDRLSRLGDAVRHALDQRRLREEHRGQLERLRQSENRFRLLAENARDIIYRYRLLPEPGFEYVSPAATEITGYTPEEHYADPELGLKIVHDDDRPQIMAYFQNRGRYGEMLTMRWVRKDGRMIWTEQRNTPIYDDSGRLIAIEGIARDITERKRLEEELLQAQKMESIGRLAGGIAHDFNNLLTIILGSSEILLDQLPPGNASREVVEEIFKAGQRAGALTQQLLAFSRKQMVDPVVLDLNTAVAETGKMLRRVIGEDVRLEMRLSEHSAVILADPVQVGQVLMNLAVNARDAMPRGGVLTIETRHVAVDDQQAQRVSGLKPGDYVLLTVSDTGCGIPSEIMPRLFEPYFTTKPPGRGTGMGLPTVFGIVTQADGAIDVESQPAAGTVVRLYWPAVEAPPVERSAASRPPESAPVRETVLIVEDEPAVRQLVARMLDRHGYVVLSAASADEALDLAQNHTGRIPLIISDVVMPGVNGPELVRQVRRLRPGIRVLLITGHADHELLDTMTRSNCGDALFAQKPFTEEALLEKVRQALSTAPPPKKQTRKPDA